MCGGAAYPRGGSEGGAHLGGRYRWPMLRVPSKCRCEAGRSVDLNTGTNKNLKNIDIFIGFREEQEGKKER